MLTWKLLIASLLVISNLSACRQKPSFFIDKGIDPHNALLYRIFSLTPGLGDYDEALEVCSVDGEACTQLLQTRGYSTIAARWIVDETLGETSALEVVVDGPIYNARSRARGSVALKSKAAPHKVEYSAYIAQCHPCGPQCTEEALALLHEARVQRGRNQLRDVTPLSQRDGCFFTSKKNRPEAFELTPVPSPP